MQDKEMLLMYAERVKAAIKGEPLREGGLVEDLANVIESLYHRAFMEGRDADNDYENKSRRSEALGLAVEFRQGRAGDADKVIDCAKQFEAYLRGDESITDEATVDDVAAEVAEAVARHG